MIGGSLVPQVRKQSKSFYSPAKRNPSLVDAHTFFFLNQLGSLSTLGWNGTDKVDVVSKLWRYNQHYFDDLNAVNSVERSEWHIDLLKGWVADNPPGVGVGWDPYPTSLRIVNWVKWHLAGNALPVACVESLSLQGRWLLKRIEWHILGNHLFANAKALIFVGAFFSGKESDRWLQKGQKIIANEIREQVLADGGHFERSPMYHAIFLEDLLDLLNLANAFHDVIPNETVEYWRKTAGKMLHWLDGMTHSDGEIAFFNDAALGVVPNPSKLFAYAERLSVGFERVNARVTHFIDSGYLRLSEKNALAIFDVAKIGPDYLPAHAHADTLSFELSLFGYRVFVNGGTSEYGAGPLRQLERSTAAHNTVTVNDKNSSEVWGGFRVARRAYPFDLTSEETAASVLIKCAHDGFRRLPGKPIHWRTWKLLTSVLVVEDQIEGRFDHAYANFHLHPAITVNLVAPSVWALQLPQGKRAIVSVEAGEASLVKSYHAPEFGKRQVSSCLKVTLGTKGARLRIDWGSFE